ncbi:hypothetical protein BE17_16275 [Sorangium cellulosum]|uniref:Uncharacterized protein n=1 Tax=Sorangium cellulosum TaxID=56 RepID=A0A150SQ27_SORCE|nr:hypothetical protein BE17_16275 [Sorangium cellulosum]
MVLFQVAESAIQNIAKHRGPVKKIEIAFPAPPARGVLRIHDELANGAQLFFQGIEIAATAGFLAKLFKLGAQGA